MIDVLIAGCTVAIVVATACCVIDHILLWCVIGRMK